ALDEEMPVFLVIFHGEVLADYHARVAREDDIAAKQDDLGALAGREVDHRTGSLRDAMEPNGFVQAQASQARVVFVEQRQGVKGSAAQGRLVAGEQFAEVVAANRFAKVRQGDRAALGKNWILACKLRQGVDS